MALLTYTKVREWLALRRKGQDFEHTPMGFVTGGKPLTENHPFFRLQNHGADAEIRPQVARHVLGYSDEAVEDEDDCDHDEEDFVLAEDHVDESEGEEEKEQSDASEDDEAEVFVDACDTAE